MCIDPVQVPMTLEYKAIMVNVHNFYRNKTAGGGLSNLNREAAAMSTLMWSPELASLAEMNSKQCNMKHDRCRNTDTFQTSGQNLAWSASSEPLTPAEVRAAAINGISKWFNEYKFTEDSDVDSFNRLSGVRGKQIGHFTCLVKDIITRVGCAVTTYKDDDDYSNVLVACNYGSKNLISIQIFQHS